MACTTEDRGEDRDKPWCSLTKDFDKVKKWKICGIFTTDTSKSVLT